MTTTSNYLFRLQLLKNTISRKNVTVHFKEFVIAAIDRRLWKIFWNMENIRQVKTTKIDDNTFSQNGRKKIIDNSNFASVQLRRIHSKVCEFYCHVFVCTRNY